MAWQVRHEGSPRPVTGLKLEDIVAGLRDGRWEPSDEVKGPRDTTWLPIEEHPQLAETVLDLEEPRTVGHRDETHLDLNALIDVTMVLLIFFIITTTQVIAVQKVVPLPRVSFDEKRGTKVYAADTVKKYMVRLQVQGQPGQAPVVHLDGKEVDVVQSGSQAIDVDKLSNQIRAARAGSSKTELILDARDVSWGTVTAIQDAARAAGIQKIHHLHRMKK